jgi:hypothetical protein
MWLINRQLMVIVYMVGNHLLFVGDDKFENDGLIKYSQRYMRELSAPILWFHVDDLSSPHAYLRLNEGEAEPPPQMVQLCAQIVKNGSIEGVKRTAVDVIYTSCSNLTKSKGMKVGQVSFARPREITYMRGVRRDPEQLRTLDRAKQSKSIPEMERELDDLIYNYRKNKKRTADAPEDDEGWGDEPPPQEPPRRLFEGIAKAEFSTTMEDDFM